MEQEAKLKAFDPNDLYLEEKFVDLQAGSIIRMTPVDVNRKRDEKRPVRYFSSIVCGMNGQPVPVGFEIPAESLAQAIGMWEEQAKAAGDSFVQQAKDRQMQSRLVVPSSARMPS